MRLPVHEYSQGGRSPFIITTPKTIPKTPFFKIFRQDDYCRGLREIPTALSGSLAISRVTDLHVFTSHNRQRAMSITRLLSVRLESEHYQSQYVARMLQPGGTKQANNSGQSIACLHRWHLVWSFACGCFFKQRVCAGRGLRIEQRLKLFTYEIKT